MTARLEAARRTIAFARHLRLRQVTRRLRLAAQRRALTRLRALRPAPPAAIPRPDPPPPLFAPRRGHIGRTPDGYTFSFLNRTRHLGAPVAWSSAAAPEDQLWTMHLHYMEYLEEVDDQDLVRLVDDWIAHNPPYRPGSWWAAWNSYALSIRVVVWMQQLAVRDRLPPAFVARAHASLAGQLGFLARHLETDLLGNHLIKNLKALLWGAAFFAGSEAAAWAALARRHLEREVAEQVLADGVHYERSPSYHAQVFADLLECRAVLDPGGALAAQLDAVLLRMARAAAELAHPDGGPALFNDAGLGMAYPPAACLAACRALTGVEVAPRRQVALPEAGYFGLRDGGFYLLADCGALGPDFLIGHGHGDILSFEASVGGHRLIVDQGVYEYVPGPRRATARSASSHNTVTVGEGDQGEFFGAFRCGRRAQARCLTYAPGAAGFVLEGSHDGFAGLAGRPRPVRRFEVEPSRITIRDRVEGGAGQALRARLLVHPGWRVEADGRRATLSRDGLRVQCRASGPVRAEPAVWWPDLGAERPTRRLVLDYGRAPGAGECTLEVEAGAPEAA